MARLINILAASVGGGLLLGAGIRLGEALVAPNPAAPRVPEAEGKLAARLGALEDRLLHLETESPRASIAKRAAEVEAIRSQMAVGDERVEALGEIGLRLRGELQSWLEDSVAARMADVEYKLRAESEHSRKQMLDAFVESVQTRVMSRIAKLEEEVAGQSAAMRDLRECSLRTEQSMQKLLGGLDRLIVAQQPPSPDKTEAGVNADAGATSAASPSMQEPEAPPVDEPDAPPPVEEPLQRARRWGVFS